MSHEARPDPPMRPSETTLEPVGTWLTVADPPVQDDEGATLILPPSVASGKLERGIVLAAGPEVPMVEAGDVILYCPCSTYEVGAKRETKLIDAACVKAIERDSPGPEKVRA